MSEALERSQLHRKEEVLQDREIGELLRDQVVVKLMDLYLEISLKKSMVKLD